MEIIINIIIIAVILISVLKRIQEAMQQGVEIQKPRVPPPETGTGLPAPKEVMHDQEITSMEDLIERMRRQVAVPREEPESYSEPAPLPPEPDYETSSWVETPVSSPTIPPPPKQRRQPERLTQL